MLILLPNLLSSEAVVDDWLAPAVTQAVLSIDGLIAESPKGGRAFLKLFPLEKKISEIPQAVLNEHTSLEEQSALLLPLQQGQIWGLVSDAGLPCLADPGARLVARARELGIVVRALSGPSAFVIALMLSGFSAQSFTFHGYLAREGEELKLQLQQIERQIREKGQTQGFIETPYRNMKLLGALLAFLGEDLLLSIAWNLTAPDQGVITLPIRSWKKSALPKLDDKPAVFLLSKQ